MPQGTPQPRAKLALLMRRAPIGCKFRMEKGRGRRARSSRLPWFPFRGMPASLTEGGQPAVCWPAYETPSALFWLHHHTNIFSAGLLLALLRLALPAPPLTQQYLPHSHAVARPPEQIASNLLTLHLPRVHAPPPRTTSLRSSPRNPTSSSSSHFAFSALSRYNFVKKPGRT